MCKCGCNSCETENTALILKESKFVHTPISEGLKYHIDNQIPLSENIYRIGSKEYMKLYTEARSLYSRGKLDVNEADKYFLTETHVGSFGMFEGKRVPLDIPMISEQMDLEDEIANEEFGMDYDQLGPNEKEWVRDEIDNMSMNENEDKLSKIKQELEALRPGISWIDDIFISSYDGSLQVELDYTLYPNEIKQLAQIATKYGMELKYMTGKNASLVKNKLNENIDTGDFLNKNRDQIELDFGPRTFRMLQMQLMKDDEAFVKDWLVVNGYMEEEKLPFEENQIDEDLCKKGKNYIAKRKRAGEKSSAYLSGRAVRVCKGQIKAESEGKAAPYGSGYKVLNIDEIAESLRDWFKKENWVRINTSGNISGDCGTMKKGKATTRCLPKKKAQSMTKAERKATVAKKVRGSKKGKQFVSVNENFEMGDRVKLTPDYEETPGEVFTITQTSGNKYFIADEDGRGWYTYGDQLVMADDEYINEAKKKKKKEKKDPPIGKPKRGGSKAYYVYVRDPKTKKVKKVSFGSGGLRAKIRNPKARKAFAARHNCKNKKDRTKAGYWSCNLPRYAPQLGLGAKMNTFW